MRARNFRHRVLAVVWLASIAALATPIVPWAWRARPLILGMPPAFVWIIAWLAVVFATLVWVYRGDAGDKWARRQSNRSKGEG